jgi:hypothetical protein
VVSDPPALRVIKFLTIFHKRNSYSGFPVDNTAHYGVFVIEEKGYGRRGDKVVVRALIK